MIRLILFVVLLSGANLFASECRNAQSSKALVRLEDTQIKLINKMVSDLASNNFRTRLTAQKKLKELDWLLKIFLYGKLKSQEDPELKLIAKKIQEELDIRIAQRLPKIQFLHRIISGDTLVSVADLYKTEVRWIKAANNIKSDSELKTLKKIYIPVEKLHFAKY